MPYCLKEMNQWCKMPHLDKRFSIPNSIHTKSWCSISPDGCRNSSLRGYKGSSFDRSRRSCLHMNRSSETNFDTSGPGMALRCSFVIVQLLCLSIVQHPLWESQTGLVIGSSSFLAEFPCNSKGRVTALDRGVRLARF